MSLSDQAADRSELTSAVKSDAQAVGFDLVGIAPAVSPPGFPKFQEWLRAGFAGEMQYLPRREAAYENPRNVSQKVVSIIMLAINYRTSEPHPTGPNEGRVARYAWGTADYHDLIRERLRLLSDRLHTRSPGCTTRGVVDTAPLLERDFARLSGLGWFGKNTMLINRRAGSWLLLAALLTDLDLEPDSPHQSSHCGTCTRCLDVCPTDAFVSPYVLDARRCISYLTIELKGMIPGEFRSGIGEWMFGCDLCQDVCPWNKKAPISTFVEFQPQRELDPAEPLKILQMSRDEFDQRFSGTPLERPGFDGLRRNAIVVIGNRGDASAIPALIEALNDPSPMIRGTAVWALGRFNHPTARKAVHILSTVEQNESVLSEIREALQRQSSA